MNNTRRAFRNDAIGKVTGKAKYADDYKMHGMLHAVPVYADAVHAKIIAIDFSQASAQPGVVCVLTAQDIPGVHVFGQIIGDYQILAKDSILSNGDVVAIIVAHTRAQAMEAIPYVKIDLEHLSPILDPEQALKPSAALIHPEHGSNICNEHRVRRGDLEKAISEADLIIEQEFLTSRIEHAYLEPEAGLAFKRSDGVFEVVGSMQHPFSTRRFVAAVLGIPLADVEVKTIPMGGGFGGKDDTAALVCARAALAAWYTGKPVKMVYDRQWSMRESYKRHPYKLQYRMGLKKDGKIHFVKVRIVTDGGAYCSVTPWVTWRSTVQCCGCYEVPNVQCDTLGVYTNNIFCGAMRGFGSPQVNFAIEQLIEMAGEKLGLDEIEIRLRNMVRQGSTTITGQKLDTHVVSLNQVMDAVLEHTDYRNKRLCNSFGNPEQDEWYGIGFAISYRGMSLGAEGVDFNSSIINVQPDGSVLLETGVHENGQGSESAMILICAEHLGIDKEHIRYRMASTSNIPDGGTTVASRGTIMGGGAVVKAAQKLKDIIAQEVADHLHLNPLELTFHNNQIYHQNKVIMSFSEAVALCYSRQVYPYAFGTFQAPKVDWDEHTGQGNAYFTWVYGCQAVELKVNPVTKQVTLLNMVAAHDVGKVINPEMLAGQFFGGMAMATGYGLFEECLCENGKVVPSNFHQYRICRATDLPEMTAIFIENSDPLSPSEAKGIGEPTNELMAPAIANALYHATGKRFFSQPMKLS